MKTLKKASLAAAICAAIAHIPAQAAEAPSTAAWRVHSSDPAIAKALEGTGAAPVGSAAEIAAAMQARASEATGILSLETTVDVDARDIDIEARPVIVPPGGAYAGIFDSLSGHPLTRKALAAKARLAQEAARYDNRAVAIDLRAGTGAGDPMVLDVKSTAVDGATVGGSVGITTFGQRYSGRVVASGSAYLALGNQTQVQASVNKGLSGLSSDSRGGYYDSASVEVDHVFSSFGGSLKLNDTRYKQGGALLPFDLRGHVQRLDAEGRMPLSAESTLVFGVGGVRQDTISGAAGLSEHSQFTYGMAGYSYAKGCLSANAKLYQGLGGSRSFNVSPLSGGFDPRFTALSADARCAFDLGSGWSGEVAAAIQKGSRDTPSAMQFYGGGTDRGRAFNTGNIAGPSGVAGSATLAKDIGGGRSLYAGVDSARVAQAIGPALSQSSVYAGVRAGVGKSGSLDIGIAKPLSAPPGFSKKPQLSFTLTLPF